jgi:hypothetical protein
MDELKGYETLFSLFNGYRGSVCMGISGPEADKAKAVGIATERCLQYLAFYRGLAMQVNFGSIVDSDLKKAVNEYEIIGGTSDSVLLDAARDFEIIDVVWLGGKVGAVVFAKLPEMGGFWSVPHNWRNNAPEISGYNVVVATSEKSYSSIANAIEAATFRAAQALVDAHYGTVNVNNTIVESKDDHYRGDSYSIWGNRLEGFSVLAYEYDYEENRVYALAVSRK